MFVYIVFIIFAAWVTLGGRLISTNPVSSAKNVLISAWFFWAAYSSLKDCHQYEMVECASNCLVLSCDALAIWRIIFCKRGMQTFDCTQRCTSWGSDQIYASNQRSPNMMAHPSRAITNVWEILLQHMTLVSPRRPTVFVPNARHMLPPACSVGEWTKFPHAIMAITEAMVNTYSRSSNVHN